MATEQALANANPLLTVKECILERIYIGEISI
jgi:hypothetical protein